MSSSSSSAAVSIECPTCGEISFNARPFDRCFRCYEYLNGEDGEMEDNGDRTCCICNQHYNFIADFIMTHTEEKFTLEDVCKPCQEEWDECPRCLKHFQQEIENTYCDACDEQVIATYQQ